MTKQADFKRRVRARMARTGESYTIARRRLLDESAEARMAAALHVSNGDCTDLAGTGLARHIVYWRDTLHEGPVPALGHEELRRVRAAFLMGAGADDHAEGLRMFERRDAALEAHRDGEYVLWFEADLYDQLQIAQILSRLAELQVPAGRITLICIGEHPGIARFGGLGQLRPDQLAELPATRACATLTPAALDLATRAWAAFRAPAPDGLPAVAAARSTELRFLGEAFERLCREYPSTRDGLSSPNAAFSPPPGRGPRRRTSSPAPRPARPASTSGTPGASRRSTASPPPRTRCCASGPPARPPGPPPRSP
ncbi:hypothetical protein ACFQ0B_50790 [Nonomuraea thailandensis]